MSASLMPLAFTHSGPALASVDVFRDTDLAVAFGPRGETHTPVILYDVTVGLPFAAECVEWYADDDRLVLSLDRGEEDTCEAIAVPLPDYEPGEVEVACTAERGDVLRFSIEVYPD